MNDKKKILSVLLEKLNEQIGKQGLQSESDLAQVFGVPSQSQRSMFEILYKTQSEPNPTLLEILGYSSENVEDHPFKKVEVGTTRYSPDYVLKNGQKSIAIIDIKAPDISLDKDDWARQICSYCREEKAPLGLLFNGREARVFINPEVKGLTQHKDKFTNVLVATASQHDIKQLVELLLKFSVENLELNAIIIAKQFALKRNKELANKKRRRQLQEILQETLANPSEQVLSALTNVENIWDDVEPQPSEAEVISAWLDRSSTVKFAAKNSSISNYNGSLRQMVAAICAAKGLDYLKANNVKGLRFRGHGGNGYYLIPQGNDVPTDLFVGNVSANDAARIMSQLERL